jgi:transcriptional regulator with PAS, ATPase and Fis domain
MRLGDPKPISLDVRVISATNRNLLDAVNNKKFRADLYYRINRGYIHIPPLRKRGDDVLILADNFLEIGNKTYDRNILGFSEEVIVELRSYHFPGNIRELENIIINAVATTSNNQYIESIDLPDALHDANENEFETGKLTALENVIEEHILYVMKKMGNNVQKAAPILGVSERTLQRRLKTIRDKKEFQRQD